MIEIIPAIMPRSFQELREAAESVNGLVGTAQIDIMDGDFTPATTWPYTEGDETPDRQLPYKDSHKLEIDLMVANPEEVVDAWVDAGASAIILHLESLEDPSTVIANLKLQDIKVGLSINPSTKSSILEEWIESVDFVQFMGNDKIGYHGVKLDENVYDKIKELRKLHPKLEISVDIGVNFETAPKLVKAGATKLVSGSAIYDSPNVEEAILKLAKS